MKFEIRISLSSQPLCIVRTSSEFLSNHRHVWRRSNRPTIYLVRDIYETEGEGMHFSCSDIRQHSAGF